MRAGRRPSGGLSGMNNGDSDCGGDSVNIPVRLSDGVELGCRGPESELDGDMGDFRWVCERKGVGKAFGIGYEGALA